MNYIVFDLEWNQCPDGKEKENADIPFEIIEIGAYKLDEDLNVVDTFSKTIKPNVYKHLHYKIMEISDINNTDLRNSKDFKSVAIEFFRWCGNDIIFCTWGSLDLMELQRNMQFYKMKRYFSFPLKYLDIQKLYSIDREDGKIKRSLNIAIEQLNLKKENKFHRALFDAKYTCDIMKNINFNKVKMFYSIDYFYIPKSKKEEIFINFETYSKYISRKFNTKDKAILDKEVESMRCYRCHEDMEIVIPWFSDNSKVYYGLGYCKSHGYMKCKIRMKKYKEDGVFVIKTVKSASKEDILLIEEKQECIREKRRERRQRHIETYKIINKHK